MRLLKFSGVIIFMIIIGFSFLTCDEQIEKSLPALTGTVSIIGTAEVGQTLTANVSALGGSGTISYQWIRGGTINIGSDNNYLIKTADIGSTITVTVSRSDSIGSITSASTAVVQSAAVESINKFEAIKNSDTGKIKYSYTYDNLEFYTVYLGQMANVPLFYAGIPHYHEGDGNTALEISYAESNFTETQIRSTISTSTSVAINTAEANTKARDDGGVDKDFASGGGGFNFGIKELFSFGVEGSGTKDKGETNWNNHTSKTTTTEFIEERSDTETIEYATTFTTGTILTQTHSVLPTAKRGYYKLTMFAVTDVYLYIIKDRDSPDVLYYEFQEYVLPKDGCFWKLDYSEKLPFPEKTDDSKFFIDISLLEEIVKGLSPISTKFCTVTFDMNNPDAGNTEDSQQIITIPIKVTVDGPVPTLIGKFPEEPKRSGWKFYCWKDENGSIFTPNTPITENTTLYAQWIQMNAVTFNSNHFDDGGIDANPPVIPVNESTIGYLPSNPSRPRWDFIDWNTKADGSGTAFTASTIVTDNITVYAQWECTITFNDRGNIETRKVKTPSTKVASLPTPTRTGYVLGAWNTSQDAQGVNFTKDTTVTGDTTVYAIWKVVTPTASLSGDTYYGSQRIQLSTSTPGATIYYEISGNNPTDKSNLYSTSNPIIIRQTLTLKAIAKADGFPDSDIMTVNYNIIPFDRIAAGDFHGLFINKDGTLWAWGAAVLVMVIITMVSLDWETKMQNQVLKK